MSLLVASVLILVGRFLVRSSTMQSNPQIGASCFRVPRKINWLGTGSGSLRRSRKTPANTRQVLSPPKRYSIEEFFNHLTLRVFLGNRMHTSGVKNVVSSRDNSEPLAGLI